MHKKGLLGWFASNHVAANLLMFLIITGGLLTIATIKMEIFPEMTLDMVTVTVPYRGASPEDVEDGVVLRLEEAIAGLEGIKRLNSSAAEGMGLVTAEIAEYADSKRVLDDIKAEVDRITTFPEETEKAIIAEATNRFSVISVVLYGDASERTLKTLADEIRDDLTAFKNISLVDVMGVRPYEISIEISEETLRRYSLSFDEVSRAIRESSLDVPAGMVKTSGGEILVRTEGQKYVGAEFARIVVLTGNDGTQIRLGDIAQVKDAFEDVDLTSRFDGKRAAMIKVSRIGDQDALDVAETVKKYVRDKKESLPQGVSLGLWEDASLILKSRISLLRRNAFIGLVLVFLCLLLFLDIRLAFWTTMGIPISFLGAFWLLPVFDVSINMMSLFAFIMALGIVVDDAIVVGENIYNYLRDGMKPVEAAIKGVREMCMPVVLAVLTTIFAFLPLLYVVGLMGKFLRVIPIVVISVLSVSLVEALLILPAHLSGKRILGNNRLTRFFDRIQNRTERNLAGFIHGRFTKIVDFAIKKRYITLAVGISIFLITIGFIAGGYIKFIFFDTVEADNMIATLVMPQGTPIEQTAEVVDRIEQAARQVQREFDTKDESEQSVIKHISATIGNLPTMPGHGGPGRTGTISANLGEVNVELLSSEDRTVGSKEMSNRWRQIVGEVPGVSSLTFLSEIASTGEAINIEVSHKDFDVLLQIVERLKVIIAEYKGAIDIADNFEEGKPELKLELNGAGRALGLTLSDLARQVRQGFYGEEVQRIQRGRDDIRVMLRYPQEQRRSLSDVENMWIRLTDGTEIPFKTVAGVKYGRSYATIRRVDRRRVVSVTADVDDTIGNSGEINADLQKKVLPELMLEYPGMQYRFGGEARERNESLGSLKVNFLIAMLAIYGLLAVQFKSYVQPLIVMSAIPFGIVGATLGHLLMGYNLSILSMFGLVALSGVVVNDSLIIIDLINNQRKESVELSLVLRNCAARRFRPIMLTTLTTFFGLMPMFLEQSLQAKFLVPMAISLAFGVLFATMITLLLVPALYMIVEDIKSSLKITTPDRY